MSVENDLMVLQLNDPQVPTDIATLDIPEDVLARISTFCFANGLGSLLRVSRFLHNQAIRRLFVSVAFKFGATRGHDETDIHAFTLCFSTPWEEIPPMR
jgi:hypothetical protein